MPRHLGPHSDLGRVARGWLARKPRKVNGLTAYASPAARVPRGPIGVEYFLIFLINSLPGGISTWQSRRLHFGPTTGCRKSPGDSVRIRIIK